MAEHMAEETESTVKLPEGRKPFSEVTDDEIVEAVRRLQGKDREGVARGGSHVASMLANPRPEEWEEQPCPENAATGMGLIPPIYSSEYPATVTVTNRLKKLVAAGRLEVVPMRRPRGKAAPDAYRVRGER